ncbi:MAG: DEAD/DEAH box helicase [Treponema sp.]|nr:DEAD/DEAH box helicase [Treponema sp.]
MDDFAGLGVLPPFPQRLALRSVSRPTAVQKLAIPPLLAGRSVVFRSATGTGKTFAYLLPALQGLAGERPCPYMGPELLVCAPTLELCSQIKGEIDFLLGPESPPGRAALLIGSASPGRQVEALRKGKPAVAVGNPGRLLLLASSGKLSFDGLRFLVLDEADRLAAPECREESAALAAAIAGRRRREGQADLTVAACSATVSAKTSAVFGSLLAGAALLETDEREILRERIEHWAIFSEERRKGKTLASFLAAVRPRKTLVFTGRTYDAGKILADLQRRKVAAAGLFADMDKGDRKAALQNFRSGKVAVLVASDLAARGLDVPEVTHVVSLDLDENPDSYVHRAGRTGRAGRRGIMVCIGDEVQMRRLALLEKKLGIVVHPKELYGGRIGAPLPEEADPVDSSS